MRKLVLTAVVVVLSIAAMAQLKVHSNGSITLNAKMTGASDTPTVKIDSLGMTVKGNNVVAGAGTFNGGDLTVAGANGNSFTRIYNNYTGNSSGIKIFNNAGTQVIGLNGNDGSGTFNGGDFTVIGANGSSFTRIYNNYTGNSSGIKIFNNAGTQVIGLNGNDGSGTFGSDVTIGTIANAGTQYFRGSFNGVNSSSNVSKIRFGGGESSQIRAYMEIAQLWNGSLTDQNISFTTFKGGVGSATALTLNADQSATFGGDITVGNGNSKRIYGGSGLSYIELYNSSTGNMKLNSTFSGANIELVTNNGTVAITGNSTTSGSGTFSSNVESAGGYRATGQIAPSSGSGLELVYTGGIGYVQSYNRTGSALLPIMLRGSTVEIQSGTGTTALTINTSQQATFANSVTAPSFTQSSDIRYKNILSRSGDMITYKWKPELKRDAKTHFGYVAQEVEKTYPDQVDTDEKGYKSVNYIELLVKKINELEKKVAALEKQKSSKKQKPIVE